MKKDNILSHMEYQSLGIPIQDKPWQIPRTNSLLLQEGCQIPTLGVRSITDT